jgi:hypothetical protein
MQDREIAYEQNVTGLEIAWRSRIDSFAASAVNGLTNDHIDDLDGLQLNATEVVAARLLDSEQWANVKATDISDIAYEAVGRVIDAR